jgi:hypothetical protein
MRAQVVDVGRPERVAPQKQARPHSLRLPQAEDHVPGPQPGCPALQGLFDGRHQVIPQGAGATDGAFEYGLGQAGGRPVFNHRSQRARRS